MSYMGTIVGAAALNAGKANTLAGVKAIDAHTVSVTFTTPGTYLLAEQTYTTWDVVEQKVPAGEDLVGPRRAVEEYRHRAVHVRQALALQAGDVPGAQPALVQRLEDQNLRDRCADGLQQRYDCIANIRPARSP